MTQVIRKLGLAAALAGGLVVAGCGGNDYDNTPPPETPVPPVTSEVPASASASTTGFIEYLMQLIASAADMLEPVDVSTFTAPVDDAADPTPLPAP